MPLEELAAIFGDVDEVKLYSDDLTVDSNGEVALEKHHGVEQSIESKQSPGVVLRESV